MKERSLTESVDGLHGLLGETGFISRRAVKEGWSYRADAGKVLQSMEQVCLAQTKSQNSFIGTDGKLYFFELDEIEHDDGSITGTVYGFHHDYSAPFSISGDGQTVNVPMFPTNKLNPKDPMRPVPRNVALGQARYGRRESLGHGGRYTKKEIEADGFTLKKDGDNFLLTNKEGKVEYQAVQTGDDDYLVTGVQAKPGDEIENPGPPKVEEKGKTLYYAIWGERPKYQFFAKDKDDALKVAVSDLGIPMTQWKDVKIVAAEGGSPSVEEQDASEMVLIERKTEARAGVSLPTWEADKTHEEYRLRTMSPDALATRIFKIKDPIKLWAFANALSQRGNPQYDDLASTAFDVLRDMGWDKTGKWVGTRESQDRNTRKLLELWGAYEAADEVDDCPKCGAPWEGAEVDDTDESGNVGVFPKCSKCGARMSDIALYWK